MNPLLHTYYFGKLPIRFFYDDKNNNKVLFVATDIATILNYKLPEKAVLDHCNNIQNLYNVLSDTDNYVGLPPNTKVCYSEDIIKLLNKNRTYGKDNKQRLLQFLNKYNLLNNNNNLDKEQFFINLNKLLTQLKITVDTDQYLDDLDWTVSGIIKGQYNLIIDFDELDSELEYILGYNYINISSKEDIFVSFGKIIKRLSDIKRSKISNFCS